MAATLRASQRGRLRNCSDGLRATLKADSGSSDLPDFGLVGEVGDNQVMSKSMIDTATAAISASCAEGTVGQYLESVEVASGLVDVHFACLMPGYVGWYWSVSVSVLDDVTTINDIVLLPAETAVVAPQ